MGEETMERATTAERVATLRKWLDDARAQGLLRRTIERVCDAALDAEDWKLIRAVEIGRTHHRVHSEIMESCPSCQEILAPMTRIMQREYADDGIDWTQLAPSPPPRDREE
jgi:hypothetical protein